MKQFRYIVFLLLVGMVGQGCSSRAIHEAEAVVAQADSLWQEGKMYGIDEGDSLTLAQAYETLQEHSVFSSQFSEVFPFVQGTSFLRTYAHSCYHYGKLLRAKDDPEEAMQAFINATHSRTHDYHILGRVYSNMGSICHLAGDFPLSYDMYEKSANCFLADNDTLSYYFLLNDMAYELAEQGKKEETLILLNRIETDGIDKDVLIWKNLTKAELYKNLKQYDSAIYYANTLDSISFFESIKLVIKMQSYSRMSSKDSAVYYAKQVLSVSNDLFDRNNALYVLTNEDETQDKEDIRKNASERSDIQKILEIRQGKLSQATQLLDLDRKKNPDWRWLYTVIAIVLFVGSSIILVHVWRKRKQHQQIIHEIDIKQHQQAQLIEGIATLHTEISQLSEQQQKTHLQLLSDIEATCSALRNTKDLHKEPYWKDYGQLCEMINRRFNNLAFLLQKYSLSEREVRLCVLVLLDLNRQQIAEIFPYSLNGIGKFKYRVAQKLGTNGGNLRNFLIKISIDSTN